VGCRSAYGWGPTCPLNCPRPATACSPASPVPTRSGRPRATSRTASSRSSRSMRDRRRSPPRSRRPSTWVRRGPTEASIPEPERRRCEAIVVPDLFVVDLPVEFVVVADVEDAFAGDPDPISALGLLDGHVPFLLQGLDHAVRHAVVRLALPLRLFLRHADLPRQDDLQLSFEPVLVEVNPHVRDEPVEDETPVDEKVLVGPRGHGAARRCRGLYLIRSVRGSPDAIEPRSRSTIVDRERRTGARLALFRPARHQERDEQGRE